MILISASLRVSCNAIVILPHAPMSWRVPAPRLVRGIHTAVYTSFPYSSRNDLTACLASPASVPGAMMGVPVNDW